MKRKNIAKKLFPAGLTVVALLMSGNLFFMIRDTRLFQNWKADFKDWQEEVVCILGEKMTGMLAPAGTYLSEDHADTMLEWMLTYIRQTVPVQGYFHDTAVKNAEGKNPFEEESTFYLEVEEMGLEHILSETMKENAKEGDEPAPQPEGETADSEAAELSSAEISEVSPTNTGASEGEGTVTVRQEGKVYYYQPPVAVSAGEGETKEVFLNRLLASSGYSLEKLKDFDFLMQKFFAVRETTSIRSGELNVEELLAYDVKLKGGSDSPQILIYHTHSQEEFCDYVEGESGRQIVDCGTYLSELLSSEYGYYVVHDTTPYDMKDGVLDKNEAYTYAGEGIEAILEAYPSIEVVIDLHRDGVDESVHLVTELEGKPTAKLMFVNGISRTTLQGDIEYLYNPYIKQNIAFSFQLQLAASGQYPEFIKRTMISAYRYNLHYREKSLLVEVGAQTNTTEEAMNAMEPLAKLLYEVLG